MKNYYSNSLSFKEIKKSWYFDFIQWSESIYNRADPKNERIHVIWNWGLFTVAEAYASLHNWWQIVLVKNTWRFATMMSAVIENWLWKVMLAQSPQEKMKIIEEIVKNKFPKDFDEWKIKDWWDMQIETSQEIFDNDFDNYFNKFSDENTEKPILSNQLLYRKYFLDFIQALSFSPKKPIVVSISELEWTLNKIM